MTEPLTTPAWRWALATVDVDGSPMACLETPEGLYRLAPSMTRVGHSAESVLDLFDDWTAAVPALERAVEQLADEDRLTATRRLAPLLYPHKVVCAGANYFDHLEEMGIQGATKENQRLFFFMKPPRQAVVGEGPTVHVPVDCDEFDWEIELAAVIGRTARTVTVEDALDYVAGYTLGIDFTARDHTRAHETFYRLDWLAGKGNDTCCPLGPRIVPAAAIGDPQNLDLRLTVNNQVRQDANSSQMIFSVAEQIARLSQIMTLEPGDVLLTGTPAGVGSATKEFLSVGDRVHVQAGGIGEFEVQIQDSRYGQDR